jgi:hypothetical protein
VGSEMCIRDSYTFHPTLQTGNKGNMYKTVQINYCRKVLRVTA